MTILHVANLVLPPKPLQTSTSDVNSVAPGGRGLFQHQGQGQSSYSGVSGLRVVSFQPHFHACPSSISFRCRRISSYTRA